MASEIRVNSINNRSGLGTVTIADSGLVVSGILTATTFAGNVTGNVTGNVVGNVTGNINVTSGISTVVTLNATTSIGINTSSPKTSLDLSQSTQGIALPQGTTAQRPSGSAPYIRYNTSNSALEFYNGTDWVEIISDYFPSGSTILG
jgi:hypothetical protein